MSPTIHKYKLARILDELGYLPVVSKVDKMLASSIMNSISVLGKSHSKALLHNICSIYGLSENELLTNYDLFETCLSKALGKPLAYSILAPIKKQMLINAVMSDSTLTEKDILNSSLTINDIIRRIRLAEASEWVRNNLSVSNCNNNTNNSDNSSDSKWYILLLYGDRNTKWRILSSLFGYNINSDPPKALLYSNHSSVCHNLVTSHFFAAIDTAESLYPTIRLGMTSSRKRRGNTIQSVADNRSQHGDMAILCECAITSLISQNNSNDSILKDIISSHDCIIIDEPLEIYKPSRDFRRKMMTPF